MVVLRTPRADFIGVPRWAQLDAFAGRIYLRLLDRTTTQGFSLKRSCRACPD